MGLVQAFIMAWLVGARLASLSNLRKSEAGQCTTNKVMAKATDPPISTKTRAVMTK